MKSCSQVMKCFRDTEHLFLLGQQSACNSTVQYSIEAVISDSNPITTLILALPTPVPDNVMLADTQMMML